MFFLTTSESCWFNGPKSRVKEESLRLGCLAMTAGFIFLGVPVILPFFFVDATFDFPVLSFALLFFGSVLNLVPLTFGFFKRPSNSSSLTKVFASFSSNGWLAFSRANFSGTPELSNAL